MIPRSFLTALTAFLFQPRRNLPSISTFPTHYGVSFSAALSTQQRTTCIHTKYGKHESRSLYSRKRLILRGENGDGDRWEDQGDEVSPPQRRRNQNRTARDFDRQTTDEGNLAAQALDSSIRFFGQPVPIPFLGDISVPLIYPLSTLLGITILPPITGGLSAFFFAAYLSLGTSLLGGRDSDDFGSVKSDNQNEYSDDFGDEEGDAEEFLLPLAAFTGSLASAALISPQGLIASGSEYLSLVSPVPLLAVGLGGLTLLMGIKEMGEEEEKWKEKDRREGLVREETSRMDQWDDDLEEFLAENERY